MPNVKKMLFYVCYTKKFLEGLSFLGKIIAGMSMGKRFDIGRGKGGHRIIWIGRAVVRYKIRGEQKSCSVRPLYRQGRFIYGMLLYHWGCNQALHIVFLMLSW